MSPVLGLRANVRQFALLVAVSALVGGMVGQERTVLPLLATDVFGLTGFGSALTFVVAFGITKASHELPGRRPLADRFGRKPVLVAGWLIGLPVPILIILAPSWGWIVVANLLLGVNQGLTWSTTVIMKIDLVGPARRGLATGPQRGRGLWRRRSHRFRDGLDCRRVGPSAWAPFLLGLAYRRARPRASCPVRARDARPRPSLKQQAIIPSGQPAHLARGLLAHDAARPRLSAASQAGLVNNLNDGMAWGLLPLFYASAGLSMGEIGVLAATYPAVWAVGQVVTGGLSDRIGRKPLIAGGMLVQAAAIAVIGARLDFEVWLCDRAMLGLARRWSTRPSWP